MESIDDVTDDDVSTGDGQGTERPRISTREPEELRRQFGGWLTVRLPANSGAVAERISSPSSNGMSSETLLVDANWSVDGRPHPQRLVVRLAPDDAAVPVFREYDMERQARLLQLVAERTSVPVPRVLWYEGDASVLGSPFFVMEHIDGVVPPDVMPYNFGSWVTDATAEQLMKLERETVSVLAGIHGIENAVDSCGFLPSAAAARAGGADAALRLHVQDQQAYFDWVTADSPRSGLIDAGFAWLDSHWPAPLGPAVLSWGDSRIGNIMFRDFVPVAVLDWEMASLGPRELDLGWLLYLHRFFEDFAAPHGLPGLPDLLRPTRVLSEYERLSGHNAHAIQWYMTYAAVRHAIIMTRITLRTAHFGGAPMPPDPDDAFPHRGPLEAMLDGSYWPTHWS